MDEFASEEHRPALPWEVKAAIGFLVLLCLMEIHEGILFCVGERAPGWNSLQSAWAILLLLFLGLAAGLLSRSRLALWLTVSLIGLVAVLHLGDTYSPLQHLYLADPPSQRPVVITCGLASKSRPDWFGVFWLIAKNSFLAAAPLMLLMGRLRKTLTPAPSP